MKVIYAAKTSEKINGYNGVGLGNFDGLHIGHMTLINALLSESRFYGLNSVVYTFSKHPENILRKKLFTPLLTTERKKISLLRETLLDYLYFEEFDERFSRLQPEEFVKGILVDKLNIKLAVAGFDYRFGYKGQGDTEYLKALGGKLGFKVIVIPPIKMCNEIISSTLIREQVKKGNMERAFELLGRHYSITGEVVGGKKIGSKLGFPTANIHPETYLVMPHNGVYITKTMVDGVLYNSVTNIGRNPTFEEVEQVRLETHILDFNKDIYGEDIEVFFVSKIRGEKRFSSKDRLIEQVRKDIGTAREYFLK
ncbi:MAG: bifunctional riboflavin kinase/FAD synthetase [Acetivibrionales bacterium]|jgi:riboflavin kinase/FMN adenylyltransferase